MSNNISFVGNITKDAELKDINGTALLKMSVADNVGFGDKKTTNFHNVDYWGKAATGLAPYALKGKQVFVVGEQTLRKYTNKDGNEVLSPDVRASNVSLVGGAPQSNGATTTPSTHSALSHSASTEDDLPF